MGNADQSHGAADHRRASLIRFFTEVTPIRDRVMPLECSPALRVSRSKAFMGRYAIRIDDRGAAVFDGEILIASYVVGRLGSRMRVSDDYQGQGIAPNTIAAWWNANPGRIPPDRRARRTRGGHRAGLRALSLIYPDIPLRADIAGKDKS